MGFSQVSITKIYKRFWISYNYTFFRTAVHQIIIGKEKEMWVSTE
jgi:hypothetical protein